MLNCPLLRYGRTYQHDPAEVLEGVVRLIIIRMASPFPGASDATIVSTARARNATNGCTTCDKVCEEHGEHAVVKRLSLTCHSQHTSPTMPNSARLTKTGVQGPSTSRCKRPVSCGSDCGDCAHPHAHVISPSTQLCDLLLHACRCH